MFQFENFRVWKLRAINALNFYITLCMAFLVRISMESETNALKVAIIKTADPVKEKVFFCYYRLAKGISGILSYAKEGVRLWFRKYLVLENGIPSHDMFERCFRIINPKQFQKCFIAWTESLWTKKEGEIVSIDGKTMRRTFDAACDKKAIHIVSVWASENGIVMGKVKTEEKSNEITAIPELLDLLVVEGCVVTIDAMGTQKDIAKKIREKKAEHVLAVKENQPTLYKDIQDYFETALEDNTGDFEVKKQVQMEKGHGRIEKRIYYYSNDIQWMPQKRSGKI